MRSVISVILVLSAGLQLSGCAQKKEPQVPSLISFADRQRARIDPAVGSSSYSNITDRLAAMSQRVIKGTDLVVSETFLNEGKPSKGLRILIKGPAMELFGPISTITLTSTDEKGAATESTVPLNPGPAGFEAISNSIDYASQFDVSFRTVGKRGGEGTLQILAYPLDPRGKSSAFVEHKYIVQDDGSEDTSTADEQ